MSDDRTTTSTGAVQHDGDGFIETLYFYARGQHDPPGNILIFTCIACCQTREQGHAPECSWRAARMGKQA
jgi:hypothetical protein